MAGHSAAWGIEIGAFAIKAIRLERDGKDVTVSDFAVIPHKKILTTPDLDRDEMIRLSLGQFISQKDLENEHLVISVPGHAAFARFAKLPPVDPKKVPDIVKFEAVQQIPFPIDQVEWDYQTFTMEDSPEIEVGIFAITRERVQQMLGLYGDVGMTPEALTLSPVAVYNAMAFDNDLKKNKGPVIYLDIGTQATDVVIAEEGRVWIRTFPLGGTHFTEAIASAFKLNYSKAEKLKLEASSSKYAKQIMQAMRPVFSDLLQDLQRSIGYYQSLHHNELSMMVGLGSTFKIPGLRKFLGQQLQINVLRLDEYKRISVAGREAASFAEAAVNMATAYGAALQGVGLAEISANLVPVKVLREQLWHSKTKWFAAAAAIAIAGSAATLYTPMTDRAKLNPGGEPTIVRTVLQRGNALKQEYETLQSSSDVGFTAENMRRLTKFRNIWPHLLKDASDALASTNPQPQLLSGDREQILSIPASQRRLVELLELDGSYRHVDGASRRIAVTMQVQLSHDRPDEFLNDTVATWLRSNAEREGMPYRIIEGSVRINPAQMTQLTAGAEGTVLASGGGRSTDGPPRPPRSSGPASDGSVAPPQGPGLGGGGGRSGGRSGGGAAGGRTAPEGLTTPQIVIEDGPTLGGGGGGGTTGAGTQGSSTSTPSIPTTPDRPRDGVPAEGERSHADIDSLAPIPSMPQLFRAGARYYRIPITFEIEILDRPLELNEQLDSQIMDEEDA